MSIKRLSRELKDLEQREYPNCFAGPKDSDNFYHWQGSILGPETSPYAGGVFYLDIQIPAEYPFKPPRVKFVTKICHPNISSEGDICVDILKDTWSPALTIGNILLSITSLLNEPNARNPLDAEIGHLYTWNRKEFARQAREWTIQYAT
jgi:ubiquitin-conjugating enzyme E2 D/E